MDCIACATRIVSKHTKSYFFIIHWLFLLYLPLFPSFEPSICHNLFGFSGSLISPWILLVAHNMWCLASMFPARLAIFVCSLPFSSYGRGRISLIYPPTSSLLSLHILFFFYFPSLFRSKDPVSVQCFLIHISWYPIVLSFIRPSHIFAPLAPYNGGYSTSDNASDKEISTAVAAGGSINLHTQKSNIIVKKIPHILSLGFFIHLASECLLRHKHGKLRKRNNRAENA